MKYEIVTTNIIYRYYEVEADSKAEAEEKYFDELPNPVKERYGEGDFEIDLKHSEL